MSTMIQVRIEDDMKERLTAMQDKHGISISELTRRALVDILEKMEKAKTPLPARE